MTAIRFFLAAMLTLCAALRVTPTQATLTLSADGTLVYDSQGITWLANADLASVQASGAQAQLFGVPECAYLGAGDCIEPNGAMDYAAATQWVANMRQANYLGHSNWQLPAMQPNDGPCTGTGPNGGGFAFNCSAGPLGSLYYGGLGLTAPNSVQPVVQNTVGPFTNLQPDLYWSGTVGADASKGYHTFSFGNGWRGLNVGANNTNKTSGVVHISGNFLYVLPMIQGTLPGFTPIPGDMHLQLSADGMSVYDPVSNVTFVSNGTLAANNQFGLPFCNGIGSNGIGGAPACVNQNGTMNWTTAQAFLNGMNCVNQGPACQPYLGSNQWVLPPSTEPDCGYATCASDPAADPMAALFYNANLLNLSQAGSDGPAVTGAAGPFINLQPEYYWGCVATNDTVSPVALSGCAAGVPQCDMSTLPSPCPHDMAYSFNMLDGFQDTDEEVNDLFVIPYFVDVPEPSGPIVFLCALGLLALAASRSRVRPGPVSGS